MTRQTHIPAQATIIGEGTHPVIATELTCVFNGYGSVTFDGQRLTLAPRTSTTERETHAALVTVDRQLPIDNYRVSWRARTVRQLRTGATAPNPWEVAWYVFDYLDNEHFTYFILKPNGWELGRRDPSGNGGQLFLATGEWVGVAPDLARFRTVNVERKADMVIVTVPSLSMQINHPQPFAYTDGITATTCRTAFYTEDAAVECTGWATS